MLMEERLTERSVRVRVFRRLSEVHFKVSLGSMSKIP